jgi:hypothetical protein
MSGVRIVEADRAPSAESSSTANARQRHTTHRPDPGRHGAAREEDIKSALEVQDRPLGQVLWRTGRSIRGHPEAWTSEAPRARPSRNRRRKPTQGNPRRHHQARQALRLVGELITAESWCQQPRPSGLHSTLQQGLRPPAKISREIQETTMMIATEIPMRGLSTR